MKYTFCLQIMKVLFRFIPVNSVWCRYNLAPLGNNHLQLLESSLLLKLSRRQFNFGMQAAGIVISGQLVAKIIFLSFTVCTSENKNIDHQGKEISAIFDLLIQDKNFDLNSELIVTNIISTQITHESSHISLLVIQQY